MTHEKKRKVKVSQIDAEPPKLDTKVQAHSFEQEVLETIIERENYHVYEEIGGEEVNMTPKDLPTRLFSDVFTNLSYKLMENMDRLISSYSQKSIITQTRGRSSARLGLTSMKQSLEEIITGIAQEKIIFTTDEPAKTETEAKPVPYTNAFIKIVLRKTEDYLLYAQSSMTAARGTPEGDEVEKDNRYYDYITIGKGKIRRRSDSDAQTDSVLMKSREVNTNEVTYATVSCYVSNFEMYDTLQSHISKSSIPSSAMLSSLRPDSRATISRLTTGFEDFQPFSNFSADHVIFREPSFLQAKMIIGRAISSNLHEAGLRRFRNFDAENRFSQDATYSYAVDLLFRCVPRPSARERKAVSEISFCASNGDIFAVAYGVYSYSSQHLPKSGDLFVWNIKNPGEPERAFYYNIPVTAVRFSPYLPSILAIGLLDGTVEVRDITAPNDGPIAISQRSTSPNCSPVVALRWIKQSESNDASEIDPFLSLSQDGSVTRYRIIKSPFLLGFNQMTLERVEGHPEGIMVVSLPPVKLEANRSPQGINMITHPLYPDIYYMLTDEGCIHKCSTNYQHQYLEVLKCHDGGVQSMEFSPWSPKLFLTCGNDWTVRVWIEGIFKPLIELSNEFTPIHCASWSPTHSTIIVSLTRTRLEIWDIRRNILNPMASHEMDSSYNTIFTFSRCGRTVAVGNERGNVLFQALDNMPFSPHFQYDELEKAIYKAVGNDQEKMIELKSIGFFGYPNKAFVRPE